MAVYGISFYGQDLYGETILSVLDVSPFMAESRDYGTIRLRWSAPGGDWTEFRLLRSSSGFAVNEEDGELLLSFDEGGFQSAYTDTDLSPNRFYYYTVFVFDNATSGWVRAGTVQGLTLKDYGIHARMLRNLPQFYLVEDDRLRRAGEAEGPLARFLHVFARSLNMIRGETESLSWVRDIDRVSGALLPAYAQDLGLVYEPEIGMRQTRIWLRNAIYLYKIKGTRLGVEGVASALTGWGADARAGYNTVSLDGAAGNYVTIPDVNLLDADTAHTEQALGKWGGNNATISRSTTRSFFGNASIRSEATGTGASSGLFTPAVIDDYVPVTAGQTYTLGAQIYAETDPGTQWRVQIDWRDAAGANISFASTSYPLTVGEWIHIHHTATAPANAAYIRINLYATSSATAGSVVHFDAIYVRQGADPTFVPSMRIVGNLDLRMHLVMSNWDDNGHMIDKYTSNAGYLFRTGGTRQLALQVGDGTDTETPQSPSEVSFTDNAPGWVRVNLSLGSQAEFLESDDGSSWTSLGTSPVTQASMAPESSWLGVARDVPFDGEIISFEIRDGIDGPVVASADFNEWGEDDTSRVSDEGHTISLFGDAVIDNYVTDAITIDFQANRINFIPNPSLEVDTAGWSSINATVTRETDADNAYSGDSYVRVAATAAGDAGLEII